MAEVAKGIIDIEINTGSAASQLKALQAQINSFNLALNKGNQAQGVFQKEYSKELQLAINRTGSFTAETIKLATAASVLDKNLAKGKSTLGQFFSAKFNKDSAVAAEVMGLAAERARRLQTQFIATAGAANGMQDALAVRPLAAFSSEIAIAGQKAEIMSAMFKQGTTQLINFGKNVQWAGRQLMVGFTVPLTIFGSVAGKTFMDLEKQVVGFKKVYGDMFTTPAELNQNLEAVKGLAAEYTKYGIAVKDTIGLAAQAAAAGRQNADLTDAVSQATRLATLGQMDQNAALETTISLQSAFRLSGQNLADTINFLNMVENQTVVSLQDISAAIPRVAPVIQGLGGDVKDLTVFLAAMQEGGVDAAEGANALKSGLASLINPTKQAKEMLAGMGIGLDSIIQANKGDLMGTVMSFSQALQSLDQFSRQQALEQVFGKFQYAKLGALFDNISRQGSQAQQVIATMGYSTEQLGATADKELKTIEESFGVQLTGAIERFKLSIAPIGELFVKLAIPLVNLATKLAESFNGLSDGQKQFAAIGAVIVGVVIPAGTMLLGLFMNLLGTLLKIGQGFGSFTKGLVTGGPVGAIKALTQSSKYLSLAEMDAAMAAQQLSAASNAVNVALLEQVGSAGAATAAISKLTAAYSAMIATQGAASSLPGFGTAGAAANAAKQGKTGNIRIRGLRRNSGGGVPGSGNTDTVPAMLTPGEFVVNKKATKNNLGLLKDINSGKIQRFNDGGEVARILGLKNIAGGFGSLGRGVSQIVSRAGSSSRVSPIALLALRTLRLSQGKVGGLRKRSTRSTRMISEQGVAAPYAGRSGVFGSEQQQQYGDIWGSQALLRLQENTSKGSGYVAGHIYASPFSSRGLGRMDQRGSSPRATGSQIAARGNFGPKMQERLSGKDAQTEFDILPNNLVLFRKKFNEDLERGRASAASFSPLSGQDMVTTSLHLGNLVLPDGSKLPPQVVRSVSRRTAALVNDSMSSLKAPIGEQDFARIVAEAERQAILTTMPKFGLNSGGTVPGTGNSDTVSAMLTPGEFVINKDAAKKNGQLLNAINNGEVRGYGVGGIVGGVAQLALPTAGYMAGQSLSDGNELAGMGGMIAAQMLPSLIKFRKSAEKSTEALSGVGKIGNIAKGIGPRLLGLTNPVGLAVTGFAALGFGIYKLNKSLVEAQKSGAKLSNAMYGSAEKTKAMGDAFGRESYATAARRKAVEKAGGQEITQEAVAASGEFMKSDAASQMIKDLEFVKKSGEDVALALRNQLASSIVAGVISPEEAKAIALDMGKELNDEKLAVNVSGQLSTLLGPKGEKLVDNIVDITAQISPKIDSQKIKAEAETAFNSLNPGEKFVQWFKGGKDKFAEDFAIDTISAQNTSALTKEAEARQLLNFAYQEGTITLKEYLDQANQISKGAKARSKFVENANAQAMGFESADAMKAASDKYIGYSNIDTTGMTQTEAQAANQAAGLAVTQDTQGKKAFDAIVGRTKEALKQSFLDAGMEEAAAKQMLDGITNGVAQVDPGIFEKLLSQQFPQDGISILINLEESGDLTAEDIDRLSTELTALNTIPNIDKIVGLDMINEGSITELYKDYVALEKQPDIYKGVSIKDGYSETLNKFGIDYTWLMNLPNTEKIVLLRNITTYETARAEYDLKEGGGGDQHTRALIAATSGVLSQSKQTFGQGATGPTGSTGSGGGGGGQTLAQYIKEFEKATNAKEKYLNITTGLLGTQKQEALALIDTERYLQANEAQRKKLLALAERQMVVQRATAFLSLSTEEKVLQSLDAKNKALDKTESTYNKTLRAQNKALDELSKKEDAVNKGYDERLKAIDRVSEANSRLSDQEQSRASLASALASGDISAAASAMSEMTKQNAENQLEDTRRSLEEARESTLAALTVEVNGQLVTRQGLLDAIEVTEAALYEVETQRLSLSEQRAATELRIYLLQQKQTIEALKAQKKLTDTQKAQLATLIADFKLVAGVDYNQYKNYGGKIAKMAFGRKVPGMGMTDKVPAMLTPGEFVVRKNAAKTFGPILEAMNGGVFPGIGGSNAVPTNNFLEGIGSPRYSIPQSNVGSISAGTTSIVSPSSTMYNNTYNVNVNVSGTNASPDDIANVVMSKLSQQNSGSLRSYNY